MNIHKNEQDTYAYKNAKKFVQEIYLKDNFDVISSNAPFIEDIIGNLRNDIRRFDILRELDISEGNFYQKLDRLEHNLLKKSTNIKTIYEPRKFQHH